jgi:hypothetical protein
MFWSTVRPTYPRIIILMLQTTACLSAAPTSTLASRPQRACPSRCSKERALKPGKLPFSSARGLTDELPGRIRIRSTLLHTTSPPSLSSLSSPPQRRSAPTPSRGTSSTSARCPVSPRHLNVGSSTTMPQSRSAAACRALIAHPFVGPPRSSFPTCKLQSSPVATSGSGSMSSAPAISLP